MSPKPSKPSKRYEDKTPQEQYDEDMKNIKLFVILCCCTMLMAPVMVILAAPVIFGPQERFDAATRGPVQEHVFELTSYDPPKHVYVDLRDTQTGQRITRLYVSKHCNSHRETMHPGALYRLQFSDPRPDSKRQERLYEDLYDAICKGKNLIPSVKETPDVQ